MQKQRGFSFLLMLAGILLIRCANPGSPEGGSKDILPPRLMEAEPPNYTIHFQSKKIILSFDEFVQLKDQTNQIIISPPVLPNTDFKLRGKSIVIELSDPLLPNTTYTINFGGSILDLTENNPARNFKYVFSTGTFIDSLSLNGKIINAFDLSPEKNVYAMLYMNNNDTVPFDSLPFKVRPYYITKTDESGEFHFTNLSDKPLLLFALKDQNGNSIYDLPNERIAFYDSLVRGSYIPVAVTDTAKKDTSRVDTLARADSTRKSPEPVTPAYTMRMFAEKDTVLRLMKKETIRDGQLAFYFSTSLRDAQFIPLKVDTAIPLEEYSAQKDTVFLWLTRQQQDTLRFRVVNNGIVIDTSEFAPLPVRKKTKRDEVTPRIAVNSNVTGGTLNHFHNNPVLTASYPLERADFSSVLLISDKDTSKVNLSFRDSIHRKIEVHHTWKDEKKYKLLIPDSVFFSYTGLTNDTLYFSFKTLAASDYGSLVINVNPATKSSNYLLQLVNEKDLVFSEKSIKEPGKIQFTYITPGTYRVKVILDNNSNGKWDAGIFAKRIQPEQVFYFSGKIEVRANWDVEENWDF